MMYLKSLQNTAKVESSGKFRVLKICEVCCDGFTALSTYSKHVEECINGVNYKFVHTNIRTYEDHIGKVREHPAVFFYDLETYRSVIVGTEDSELVPVSFSWSCNVRPEIGLPTFVSYKTIASSKTAIGDFSYIPDIYFEKFTDVDKRKLKKATEKVFERKRNALVGLMVLEMFLVKKSLNMLFIFMSEAKRL